MYFAIQVTSGRERKIIELIQRKLEVNYYLDCFNPIRKRLIKSDGSWKEICERFFPGYIFVDTDNPEQLFIDLKKIPYFTKLLGKSYFNNTFIPLSSFEAKTIDLLANRESGRIADISLISISEGKRVTIISGPLVGLEGFVKSFNMHKKTMMISLDMIGRECEILLGIDFVKSIGD